MFRQVINQIQLAKLWREAERLGVVRLDEPPELNIGANGGQRASSYCIWRADDGDTITKEGIWLDTEEYFSKKYPVITLAHELGHALQTRIDPQAQLTLYTTDSKIRSILRVYNEHDAWNLGQAVLDRLGIRYNRAEFNYVRNACVDSYVLDTRLRPPRLATKEYV